MANLTKRAVDKNELGITCLELFQQADRVRPLRIAAVHLRVEIQGANVTPFSVSLVVVTFFAVQSAAEPMDAIKNQSPLNECVTDSDCTCVLSADHCGFFPEPKKRARNERADLLKGEKEQPACFGPTRYAIPKCQESTCICQDGGKAPD